jgi:hypothetical protein
MSALWATLFGEVFEAGGKLCPRTANFDLLGATAFAAPAVRIRNRTRKVLFIFHIAQYWQECSEQTEKCR